MDHNEELSKFYYCDWIMIATTAIAFIVALKSDFRRTQLQLIIYYVFFALVTDCISLSAHIFAKSKDSIRQIDNITISLFLIIEMTLLYLFIYRNVIGYKKKAAMRIIYVLFFLFIFISRTIKNLNIQNSPIQIFGLESLCLVIPSLFYFHELFRLSPTINFKNLSSFWVITGILFYNGCSLPIYILIHFIHQELELQLTILATLNFILYSVLILFIIIAFLCSSRIK
jgi:hypothetical protein